jgi:hypothetical protein
MQEEQPQPSQPEANWQFNPEETNSSGGAQSPAPAESQDAISWTASEFIAHDKGFGWFALLGVAAAVLMLLTYVLTRDFVSSGIVLVMIICFGAFAVRKPRTLPYRVDRTGVHIDNKSFSYEQLKSFSLIQEGGVRSIMLMPLKRFMPPISIYMDPTDEENIVEVLSNYLPMEQREQELIDKLMRRLRF